MTTNLTKSEIVNLAVEIFIKLGLLTLVLFYAFAIIKPFIIPVLWGVIIAVTLAPFVDKLNKKIPTKRTLIIVAITFVAVSALLIPTYMLSDSVITSSKKIATELHNGSLVVPAPTENVKEWPLVGEKIYNLWYSFSTNLEKTLVEYKPQMKVYAGKIASTLGSSFLSILQFVASLIIAAVFLSKSEGSVKLYHTISRRLLGQRGVEWAQLSALTIRSVVQGVIGIAIIQATFSFIGLAVMEVPLAWLWAFIILLVVIVQIPAILILGPIIAYVFSYADTTPATIFAIYAVIVAASDNVLKPLLLGRGVDIPMLVILLGAIGGMLLSGILGLFVGAVGLSIAYKLFSVWLEEEFHSESKE